MSNRLSLFGLLLGALVLLAGLAIAQQGPAGQKKVEPHFMVAPSGSSAVLLETTTGETWVLHNVEGTSVWRPAKRFNQENDFLMWQDEHRKKRQKELREQHIRDLESKKKRLDSGTPRE